MATIEKPKQKRKKKVKQLTIPDVDIESLLWSPTDIDFPSTSTSEEVEVQKQETNIAAHLSELAISDKLFADQHNDNENGSLSKFVLDDDASISSECKTIEQPDDFTEVSNVEGSLGSLEVGSIATDERTCEDESEEASWVPTAPSFNEEETLSQVQYPDLQGMQKLEETVQSGLKQKVREKISMKPFNERQLKELYHNPELILADEFETEFISNELSCTYKDHPLFDLLKRFSQCRYNLKINMLDLHSFKRSFEDDSTKVWKIEKRELKYSGTCADGERIFKTEIYDFAVLNEAMFQNTSTQLTNTLNLVCCNYMSNLYACETLKIQIEQSVRELLSHTSFADVVTDTELMLNKEISREMQEPLCEMRTYISILFYFLRRHAPDKEFSNGVKNWLNKITSVYLRVATWQDHLFLIYHVLRCPAGLASWATQIIQIPKPSPKTITAFACNEVHHCVAFLKVLLMPTKQRNEFLAQLQLANTPVDASNDEIWTIIDSDGEEDHTPSGECVGLKENDLTALFNQVPFEHLFRLMTFSESYGELYSINQNKITGHHLLKFIAFSTNLVQLIGEGLKTYDSERYKQFAKLLSRLVRHCVQYVSDMYDIFKNNTASKDAQLCSRIQIEYDTFLLRASYYIYKSRFLGAWQYLAVLPFSELYVESVWKLYYSLAVGFNDDVIENISEDFKTRIFQPDFLNNFNDSVIDVPAEDMYYLLQTFSSMALARDIQDYEFINRIAIDLFKIGFVNRLTKETCYKISRDLLVNITTKYPELISTLLYMLKDNFRTVEKFGPYLFKSLPLDSWKPSIEIFEIVALWLLNFGFQTAESAMARTIFSRLNWNFDSNGELFLPHDIHVRMACLIVDVSSKHVPETIGLTSITESVRQVSNLVKGQSPRQQFVAWCWNMVSVLRLHCLDQNSEFVKRTIKNPAETLRLIPEVERLQSIYQGVSDSRPIALYLSVLLTLWGHSVPQICHKGFTQLQQLINDCRHSNVIRCLQLTTPFFLECPESLSKCDKFQAILSAILTADRTYIRMAKDFISSDYPGPVVELFANMIQAQITDYFNYGLATPTLLIKMWLECLTVNPNWFKDFNSMYIIDLIIRIAFQFTDAWLTVKDFFKCLCKTMGETKPVMSSSFIPFLGGGSQSSGFISSATCSAPWLAFLTLEIDHEVFEIETKLWHEIIRQMQTSTPKSSLDSNVKVAAKLVGCPPCQTNSLVIFKLANLIINCSYNTPLLPIFCQRFFTLYLTRVRMTADEARDTEVYGVSDKFFEHNVPLFKKLKKFLIDAEKTDTEMSLIEEDEIQKQFLTERAKLFNSFALWLEETRLNKILNFQQLNFPPQYDLNRLATIFSTNEAYWMEFVQMSAIRQVQKDEANSWHKSCFRYVANNKIPKSLSRTIKEVYPKETILRHLQSYDAPLPPPPVKIEPLIIKKFSYSELKRVALNNLQSDFKKLVECSRLFDMSVQEISSLDSSYREMLKSLHENKLRSVRKEIRCASKISANICKGSNYVTIDLPYHILNEVINNKITINRDRYIVLLNKLIAVPTIVKIMPIIQIQYNIRRLLEMYHHCKVARDERQWKEISHIGISYFYYLINGINKHINEFSPAQELCTMVLSQLGIFLHENQNTEGINLLKTALNRPDLLTTIAELFVPSQTVPESFLQMYKFIIDSHMKKCDSKTLFVLLSKFDVNNWLAQHKPKLADISQLVQLIVQGLECWNQKQSELIQGVLRRHLIYIYIYDFPEHYGEVLQIVLKGCSDNKLMPAVLLDLLNSIYRLSNCPELDFQLESSKAKEQIIYFATNQRTFSYQELQQTMAMFAKHFQHERLQHGLHGLYPIHKEYCEAISLIFRSFAYALIVSSVHAYPGVLADNLIESLWPSICEMYSPWLIPYYTQNMQNTPANWIRQVMANTPILLPWGETYGPNAHQIFQSFIDCIHFFLETFPACDMILGHIFTWYEAHFCNLAVPRHIYALINSSLMLLPWSRLKPAPIHIYGFYRVLQQYLPECHAFIGYIFLRISWTPWVQCNMPTWDYTTRLQILSTLLIMFVKLSYEPQVRENQHLLTVLQEASGYPWHLLDYQGIEGIFEWFVLSTEPSAILNLPFEHKPVDNGILKLLQSASSMQVMENAPVQLASQVQSKRILYVKTIVRMLRLSGSKNQQLLTTPEGVKAFQTTVINLIKLTEGVVAKENQHDSIHMMIEIIGPLQSQGEFVSRLFVDSLIIWQSTSGIGNIVLNSTINAIGTCKSFTNNILILLEATIFNYFRHLESTKDYHNPTWLNLFERLGGSLPPYDLANLVQGDYLLCMHVYIIHKLKGLKEANNKIMFLQNVYTLLEEYKTSHNTESRLAMIWGLLIASGESLMKINSNACEPLMTLARYLQTSSNTSDGWGEGLLGAMGLKKDAITNKRRILTRCLAAVVFSLFSESENQTSSLEKEYKNAIEELKTTINTKKYIDVRQTALHAIEIIERISRPTTSIKEAVCSIIRLFYTDCFLVALEDVWASCMNV